MPSRGTTWSAASYGADLPLWRELADQAGGPVLDLGAGTGRVALDLARHGHDVTAVDSRASCWTSSIAAPQAAGLAIDCVAADARELRLDPRFGLVLAPMQLLQIVGGPAGRADVLRRAAASLADGGLFAAAIAELERSVPPPDALPPVPDVGELDGWVYSSLPVDVRPEPGGVAVERLRQRVSPDGALDEERHTQRLDALAVEELERAAAEHGLRAAGRREIPETPDHVGSMVVVCRR